MCNIIPQQTRRFANSNTFKTIVETKTLLVKIPDVIQGILCSARNRYAILVVIKYFFFKVVCRPFKKAPLFIMKDTTL